MRAAGVVETANTECASPVIIALHKDGSIPFCIDYRRLNSITIRDGYPIQGMDDFLDSLCGGTIFSKLKFNSGYRQGPLAHEDREKTACISHHGLFRFTGVPFCLTIAPEIFTNGRYSTVCC